MKTTKAFSILLAALFFIGISACTKDNEEDLFAEEEEQRMPVTLEDVSFNADVLPILTQSCNFGGCHGSGAPFGDFTSYPGVNDKKGNFPNRVFNPATRDMPRGRPPLLSSQIELIQRWIDEGANDN